MNYQVDLAQRRYRFRDLRELMAKASPLRSGDCLAGIAATNATERVAAQYCLAEVPLRRFLEEPLIPYERDEVTRLILDSHDPAAFAPVADLSVGEFRDWLLSEQADTSVLTALAPGLTPEMVAEEIRRLRLPTSTLGSSAVRSHSTRLPVRSLLKTTSASRLMW